MPNNQQNTPTVSDFTVVKGTNNQYPRTSLANFHTLGSTLQNIDPLEIPGELVNGATLLPSSKCVGFWRGNENTGNWADSSMWVRGPGNNLALGFGLGGLLQTVSFSNTAINNRATGTIEMWIYRRSDLGTTYAGQGFRDGFHGRSQDGVNAYELFGFDDTNTKRLQFQFDNSNGVLGGTDVSLNQWHHVAVTWDGTNAKLWLDGVEDGTTAYTGGTANNTSVTFGPRYGGTNTSVTLKFDGCIALYRLSSSVRYTGTFTPSTSYGSDANTLVFHGMSEGSGTSIADSTSNAYTGTYNGSNAGTVNGTPSYNLNGIRGRYNTMDFDGTDDMVEVTDNASLTLGTEHTIQMWVDLDTASGIKRLLAKEHESPAIEGYTMYTDTADNKVNWRKGATTLTTNSIIPVDTWTHLMFVQDAAGMKIYINGNLDKSNATTGAPVDITENLFLGRKTIAASEFLNGQLQNVIILNKAVTPFDPEFDGPTVKPIDRGVTASTVGYWKLQETTGTSHTDSSANALTGTSSGTPTLNKVGILDKAVDFDGTDDYINVPDNNVLDITGDLTIEAWIQPDTTGTGYICSKWTPGSQESYILYLFSGKPYMTIDIAGVDTTLASDLVLTVGTWYHVAGVFNAGTDEMKLYVNGVLVKSSTGITGTITSTTAPLRIGAEGNGGNLFNGKISHVRVSNAALTPSQFLCERTGIILSNWVDNTSAKNSWTLKWDEELASNTDIEAQVRTGTISPVDSNTTNYWSFEDSFADSGPHRPLCTTTGNPYFTTGKSGRGIYFDGSNSSLLFDTNPVNIWSGGGTVEFWVYWKGGGDADAHIINKASNSDTSGWGLQMMTSTTSGELRFFRNFSTTIGIWDTDTVVAQNTWTHVSITYDDSSTTNDPTIKLNGTSSALTEVSTPAGTAVDDSGQTLKLGDRGDNAKSFDGILDEVRISDVVRTTFLDSIADFSTRAGPNTAHSTTSNRYAQVKAHLIVQET